jgi:hypothetical protein
MIARTLAKAPVEAALAKTPPVSSTPQRCLARKAKP